MKEYRVKFEFYGHKMATTVTAKSEDEAKYIIMGRVKFISIEPKIENNKYDLPDGFEFLFGGKK